MPNESKTTKIVSKTTSTESEGSWWEQVKKSRAEDSREQPWLKPLEGVVDNNMNDKDEETISDSAIVEMKSLAA